MVDDKTSQPGSSSCVSAGAVTAVPETVKEMATPTNDLITLHSTWLWSHLVFFPFALSARGVE